MLLSFSTYNQAAYYLLYLISLLTSAQGLSQRFLVKDDDKQKEGKKNTHLSISFVF